MTNAPSQVVVVGSITADVTAYSRPLPVPGETVLGDTFTLVLGGKGANQALAAARAGAPSTIIGCVGDDLFRDLVLSGLHDGGVGTAGITTVPGPTGVAHSSSINDRSTSLRPLTPRRSHAPAGRVNTDAPRSPG